jgi:hypothetical protein
VRIGTHDSADGVEGRIRRDDRPDAVEQGGFRMKIASADLRKAPDQIRSRERPSCWT